MVFRILGLVFVASCCTVQSQLCASNSLPAFPNVLPSPQVVTSPVIATTVIDNSVSNALANALQLFIVSDLIQSRLGSNCAQNSYSLGAVETIAPVFSGVDIISPCSPVEIVAPCTPVLETLAPNIYGGVTETLTPIIGAHPEAMFPNNYVTETFVPNCYGGWAETAAPVCADVITPNLFSPNIYGGVPEIIASQPCGCGPVVPCGCPNYFNNGLQEIVSFPSAPPLGFGPSCFSGIPEVVPPFISSGPACGANYFVPEVVPSFLPNFCGGIPDVLTPANSFRPSCVSEIISPAFSSNVFGGLHEVVSPIISPCGEIIASNPFGAPLINEIITPNGPFRPMSAEILIPPSIPAQLTCNIGYCNSVPCVNFNVDPLPFEPYSGGYNFPGFYF